MTMTPFQLAGNLTEIVAKNTESSCVWRNKPITTEEMARVGNELSLYLRQLLEEWKKELHGQ